MPPPFGYSENLPGNIREVFVRLCQEVVSLNVKWQLYKKLFSDAEVADLLSAVARGPFNIVEETLQHDIIMLIGRLCDAPSYREFENISFRSLIGRIPELSCLRRHIDQLITLCGDVELHRNKLVAHNDLISRIAPNQSPIPGITKRGIDRIVKRAGQILNHIIRHYEDSELAFDFPVGLVGADYLISLMKKGQRRPK